MNPFVHFSHLCMFTSTTTTTTFAARYNSLLLALDAVAKVTGPRSAATPLRMITSSNSKEGT